MDMDDMDLLQRTGDLAPGSRSTGTAVAPSWMDPFAAYGASVGQQGDFLTFNKGEYQAGQDKVEIKLGTRLVANMPGFRRGWRRWQDKKVVEDLTSLLTEMQPQQRRAELGDTDESLWDRSPEGKPVDPWVLTDIIEFADPRTGKIYIFGTGAVTYKRALGKLCTAYSQHNRMQPGMLPIIELQRDSYNHSIFGKTYIPDFKVVGWTDENAPSVDSDADDDIPFDAPAAKPAITAPAASKKPLF
jgi:hypothetical protein